ncbi:MAG: putative methyl-accepting chemotaxis protein [Acidimicrobiia bacterium]|nr:putative methyl-accepting chemotaxis protein [Acidimicrobiia bacterium]
MSIRAKIVAGFLAVVVIAVAIGGYSLTLLSRVDNESRKAAASGWDPVVAVGEMQHHYDSAVLIGISDLLPPETKKQLGAADATAGTAEWTASGEGARKLLAAKASPEAKAMIKSVVTDFSSVVKLSNAQKKDNLIPVIDPSAPDVGVEQFNVVQKRLATNIQALRDRLVSDARVSQTNVQNTYNSAKTTMFFALAFLVVAATALALILSGRIVSQVRRAVEVMRRAADGDLTGRINVTSRDEIGQMGTALNDTFNATCAMIGSIRETADEVNRAAVSFDSRTDELAAVADRVSGEAQAASANAAEVSSDVELVAAATQEMGSSVQEIANHAQRAATVAAQAVISAEEAGNIISQLGASSNEIGNVVALIQTIAEQTNLLALNATIEAARAGESGRGFAVVAGEVKELSHATAQATQEISSRINAIQGDSRHAVEAITQISQVINEIHEIQTSIATAVEQQTAVTSEIGRSANGVAVKAQDISTRIAAVVDTVEQTNAAVRANRVDSERLVRTSGELRSAVGRFRSES